MMSHSDSTVARFSFTFRDNCLILTYVMGSQTSIDYYAMFSGLVKRHNELTQQRNEVDLEIAKLKQLILATFPLLPEDKQKILQTEIELLEEQSAGLLNAIKLVFSTRKGEWITPAQVREHLNTMGFDFTQYRANPLASIATTLRRMVPDQLESQTVGEQVKYRRRITLLDRMGREPIDPSLLPDSIRGLVEPGKGVKRGDIAKAFARGRTVEPPPGLDDVAEQALGLSSRPNARIHKK